MRSFRIGSKNVYWSTTKVASHIRSGHCKGATDEEVQKFKVGKKTLKSLFFVDKLMVNCKI